jgi:transcriptional regulator with XRE-family HTH domain
MDDGAGGFGSRLRACRQSSGLSQQELAERSGLSIRAISKLECGWTRWPYPGSVDRLADALNLHDTARADFLVAAQRRLGHRAEPARPSAPDLYVPRLLPAPAPAFVGRAPQLETLARLLDDSGGPTLVTAITGMAGVGKTALAVHWAHQVAAAFPDGQLFVNLRGFGPSATPLPLADAAQLFLDALGVPADRRPASTVAQLGLYRSLLVGQRMLIILDNARDAAQIRPLLPGSPTCRVIVTSRDQLPGLTATEAARPLTVNPLPGPEARHLLARRLGRPRLAADPDATDQIIASCAGLPLALAIVAARAELRPDLPLARIAADLTGQPILDAFTDLADPAADIRTVFSWSYDQLDPAIARTFRLAAQHPAPDLDPFTLAILAGTTPEQAGRTLDVLARANLIQQAVGHECYRINTLLRAFAREQAVQHGDEKGRAVMTAGFQHYLRTSDRDAVAGAISGWPPRLALACQRGRQLRDHLRQEAVWFLS